MTFRWGIVGFGWVARDYMAPGIAAAGHRLAAVCDRDPAARAAAEALGATAHADMAAFLREPLDAVYVATPNAAHRAPVEACLAAGVPVLCEKPMAATLADAQAMADAARRTGVLYGTAFDQRRHPAHAAVREAVEAGRIGAVTAVRIVYACWLPAAWSPLPKSTGAGHDNWRIDPAAAGGGAVMDLAPHGLDLVQFLLGEPVETVAALTQRRVQDYGVDDGGVLVGRTGSGVLASLHIAYNMPDALPRRRLELTGAEGMIVAEDTMGQTPGGRLTLIDGASGAPTPLPFDAAASPFEAQARAFAAAVRGEAHDFSVERDLHTMRLLDAAYRFDAAPLRAEAASWR